MTVIASLNPSILVSREDIETWIEQSSRVFIVFEPRARDNGMRERIAVTGKVIRLDSKVVVVVPIHDKGDRTTVAHLDTVCVLRLAGSIPRTDTIPAPMTEGGSE